MESDEFAFRPDEERVRFASRGARGILTIPAELNKTVFVYHTPNEGQQTTVHIHPSDSVERQIAKYAREHDPAEVSEEEFAKPIPPYDPGSGEMRVSVKDEDHAAAGPSDEAMGDEENEDAIAVSSDDEVDDGDTDNAAVDISGVGSRDSNDRLFLHAFEHGSSTARLTLDTTDAQKPKLILYATKKGTKTSREIHLNGKGSHRPIIIQCYRFKEGRTLHIVNREVTTMVGSKGSRKTVPYKLCYVHLPVDRWHAGFGHETMTSRERLWYGQHHRQQAEHNVIVFPHYMDELERTLGLGKVERCKKRKSGKIVLETAPDESENDDEGDEEEQ